MQKNVMDDLLPHLISVAEDISKGHFGRHQEIFELTKGGAYPEMITRFAEAFGMMVVKVEAREFRLEQTIDQLRKTEADLVAAKERLSRENTSLRRNLRSSFTFSSILGVSRQMKELVSQAKRVADSHLSVLITGETGTGKELLAKAIHFNSRRGTGPFEAINCSAVPEALFESEMFGIAKGVATGVEARIGKLEQAAGGAIFLDEIGEMPLSLQSKLLRVLQERSMERVGGRNPIPVDVRVIAATNRDLRKEVAEGRFREDLFYRINGVELHIPPLRERPEDVELIARQLLDRWNRNSGKETVRFANETMELFRRYPWPGNVRELENEVERAVALAVSHIIAIDDLSETVRCHGERPGRAATGSPLETEQQKVLGAIREAGGNKSLAARCLGISREGLRKKMNRLGIKAGD